MKKNGVVFGRFQPLHNGHIEHILTAKKNCKHLFVGITCSDPSMVREDKFNLQRSKPDNNPFTYYERYAMIQYLFHESGIGNKHFTIVPFPLHDHSKLKYYTPINSTFYISIFEKWGIRKKEILDGYNLNVEVMFNQPDAKRQISGDIIRTSMRHNILWKKFVPESTLKVLKNIDLIKRLNQQN